MKRAILVWIIGFLFTFGYLWELRLESKEGCLQEGDLAAAFVVWPVLLGAEAYEILHPHSDTPEKPSEEVEAHE